MGDVITGLTVFRDELFVFCETSIFKITGTSIADFRVDSVTQTLGCADGFSVQELGGERIDIVPWHPEPEVFARRSLAPARVSKIMSDPERRVITAIVNEDQLSLAIGRNGQNVRLASQLIGWQVDLYGSREWVELGADLNLFDREVADQDYESSDFSLEELDLQDETLGALQKSGYSTFLQIIDFSKGDFLKIEGISEEESVKLMGLIEELTVLDEGAEDAETEPAKQDSSIPKSEEVES